MNDPFWRFAFDWAYGLGEPDVPGLLASTPLALFMDWQEWWMLSPPTEERADWRAAMLACVVASLAQGKGQQVAKIEDFMPTYKEETNVRRQSADELRAVLMDGARRTNAAIARDR